MDPYAANRSFGGSSDAAVERHFARGLQAAAKDFGAFGHCAAAGDVEMPVLGSDLAGYLQLRVGDAVSPVGVENFHFGDRVAINSSAGEISLPTVAERALPRCVLVLGQGQPQTRLAGDALERDRGLDVVAAPLRKRVVGQADDVARFGCRRRRRRSGPRSASRRAPPFRRRLLRRRLVDGTGRCCGKE